MSFLRKQVATGSLIIAVTSSMLSFNVTAATDPLPSWNEGASKTAIIEYVEKVTTVNSKNFIAKEDRIAVFDNDGTLWTEKPFYPQLRFAMDRIVALAPENPEWQKNPTLKAAIDGDVKAALKGGEHAILEMVMASHANMTTDEFAQIVTDWITTARDPKTGRLYTERVFQPMIELLDYLRDNDFTPYIVSGGGIEFMRPWTESAYGIPPEQIIGSSITTQFENTANGPVLRRLPEIDFIDDKAGKPVAINKFIGKKPVFVFGNSDGDWQMIQWTESNDKLTFSGIVHHTDADREYAYDRDSSVGRLNKAMDDAKAKGWTLVDMKAEWKMVYPPMGQ